MKKSRFFLAMVAASVALGALSFVTHAADSTKKVFTMVRLADSGKDPNKHYAGTKAMADYVASQLKEFGYEEGRAIITESQEELVQLFKTGKADMISETVFVAAQLVEEANSELLLKSHRKGVGSYHTVFFARKDSGINSLKDLRGRIIAFEGSGSTTGFHVPAGELLSKGFKLKRLSSPRDPVPPQQIGFVYASSTESNAAFMVHKGLAHASAFGDADFEIEKSMPAELRPDMKIFHETKELPRSLMIIRGKFDPTIKKRVKEALLKAAKDPEMKSLMKGYYSISDFEPLSKKDLQGYEEGRRLWHIFHAAKLDK